MDLAAPVALQIKPPDSMNTLKSIVDFANTSINIQRGGIQLQKETQANNERIALQKFMSTPDNFQTNGEIDLDKVNKSIPAIAPMTGADTIAKLTTLANAQTGSKEAKLKLANERREVVAGPYGVLGRAGVQDPQAYIAEGEKLKSQFPDDPNIAKLVDSYNTVLKMLPAGPGVAKAAITASQSIMTPTQQQEALSPKASLQATGGALTEIVTQPAVGGEQPAVMRTGRELPLTVPVTERSTVSINPVTQSPMVTRKDAQGNVVAVEQPGKSAVPQLAPGEAEEIPVRTRERVAVNAAASQVPTQHFNNQQIIKLAPEAITGTGSGAWTKLMTANGVQWLPGDEAGNTQRLMHFMALQSQANAQAMGAGTDAARAISEQATGTVEWDPKAIVSTAKVNDALSTGVELFNQGMEAAIKKAGGNVLAKRDFQNQWSQNFDVRAMQLHNAIEQDDKAEVARLVKDAGGRGSAQAQEIVRKAKNLERLSTQGAL